MEINTQERLAERVRELWSTRPAEQMKLFRTLRAEGYRPGEIMLEVQARRSGGVRKEKKEDLVSYETKEGQRFCFDRKSLYRQYLISERTPLQNPFTRKVLPSRLQQEVVGYGESLSTTIEINEQIFVVEPFISVEELIVGYFVSLGANYLDLLGETNLLHEGKSLYTSDLKAEAQSLEGEISAQPFTGQTERDALLTNFFQFVAALRTRPLYDTIYLHLGELLAVVPLVPREDGFDLTLQREMTVLDVIQVFYAALRAKFGGNVWSEYDIVTEAVTTFVKQERLARAVRSTAKASKLDPVIPNGVALPGCVRAATVQSIARRDSSQRTLTTRFANPMRAVIPPTTVLEERTTTNSAVTEQTTVPSALRPSVERKSITLLTA